MIRCAVCGQENPDIARFCLNCGSPLAPAAAGGEERRVVTVLFVDMVGSTARAEKLDPEDQRALLDRYYARVRVEIERFGGMVEKFIGDAVMAVFGAPVAFGDDPERAVRAALAVRDAVADLNTADPELDLQVRIAVNTGEAVAALGARPELGESMVAGDVVNTAARLQVHAPIDGIIVGEETYRSTRAAIEYVAGEAVTARGKAEPIAVWFAERAVTDAGQRRLSEAPMVGRERELELLAGIWRRVVDQSCTQLVTLVGPPGIGKSRLAYEFGEWVSAHGGRTLRGRSTPYGASTPYAAFAAHVKQVAGIFDTDSEEAATRKLDAAVEKLLGSEAAPEVASHLAALLSLRTGSQAPDRQTLFLSARLFVEALAGRQPTLLVFEDVHWADSAMLDLLDELAALLRDSPVLLLAMTRPELLAERPSWGGGLAESTAVRLEPLSTDDTRSLAACLLPRGDDDGVSRVLEIAEGNPLFIEELAASLAERPDGGELPTSIRGIISARLDALPTPERSLLLDASVVGRIFWDGALEALEPGRDALAVLASLERRDLIRREPVSRLQGQHQFRFKHVLIKDIAYQRLTRVARRTRHELVARFLEESAVETAAAEAIAVHWREAGDPERAAQYYVAAAEDAGRGWAKDHAVALYQEAMALLPDGHPERRDIQLRLAVAVQVAFHLPDMEQLRGS
jgi:class 3 adenylate cyclase